MKRIIALVVVGVAVSAYAYTPQYLEEVKGRCTFAGAINDDCVAFFTEAVVGKNPLGVRNNLVDTLRECFADAQAFENHKYDHRKAAMDVFALREASDATVDNKYAAACIAATSAVRGEAWMNAAKTAAFYAQLKAQVQQTFEAKCGTRADLTSDQNPTVVLYSKPKKSGVFFEGTDGDGTKISIACTGVMTAKNAAGKSVKIQPKTMTAVRAHQAKACVAACETTDSLCVGHVDGMCEAHCERQCK